jgi:protein-S-isoprenylcysteine O-methyltransferase Ste14
VDPIHPDRASSLVTSGPFRITRNPMYVGLSGLLTAHMIRRGSLKALLPVAAFVAVIDRVQIPPEESAMNSLFVEDYEAYRSRVPRWLGV